MVPSSQPRMIPLLSSSADALFHDLKAVGFVCKREASTALTFRDSSEVMHDALWKVKGTLNVI